MKLSVRIRLPKLSKDPRLTTLLKMFSLSQNYKIMKDEPAVDSNPDELPDENSNSLVEVASYVTLGKSEVITL